MQGGQGVLHGGQQWEGRGDGRGDGLHAGVLCTCWCVVYMLVCCAHAGVLCTCWCVVHIPKIELVLRRVAVVDHDPGWAPRRGQVTAHSTGMGCATQAMGYEGAWGAWGMPGGCAVLCLNILARVFAVATTLGSTILSIVPVGK